MASSRRLRDACLVGFFLATLFGYSLACYGSLLSDWDGLQAALRQARSWRAWPIHFEQQFNDRLAARADLVRLHAHAKVHLLHASANPRVWVGRQGWYFFNHVLDGYLPPHDAALADQLDAWYVAFAYRRAWLAERGIPLLVVVTPDKQSVYPEHLPRLARNPGPAPLDQFLARCRHDPDLNVLDLRAPLRDAKLDQPLYLRTDTHWNQVGTYLGYARTVQALARWFPNLKPLPEGDLEWSRGEMRNGDLARLLGLGAVREEFPQLKLRAPRARLDPRPVDFSQEPLLAHVQPWARVQDDPALPRVVLLGDSFSDRPFGELLAEHAARLVRVGTYQFPESLIESEKPRVVICQIVERILQSKPPADCLRYPALLARSKQPPAG